MISLQGDTHTVKMLLFVFSALEMVFGLNCVFFVFICFVYNLTNGVHKADKFSQYLSFLVRFIKGIKFKGMMRSFFHRICIYY